MINDCAYVGTTLLRYLPETLEKQHIMRSRSFWDKTFGLALNIYRLYAQSLRIFGYKGFYILFLIALEVRCVLNPP